jgi:FkbM family methyltransferase
MIEFKQDNAYDVIQNFVENNLHNLLGKSQEEISNICIVGAWHGHEIKRLLNNYPNCVIYAFEAHPEHFSNLKNTYENNDRVKLFNVAVSDEEGYVDFFELSEGGSGSLLKFTGNEYGHPFYIKEVLNLPCTTLKKQLENIEIDLLWVDVQGAELKVLKGADVTKCKSLFLEIHTHDFVKKWDEEPYKGQCYKEDLENYLCDHTIHSIGLDNFSKNGQGNSFWLKK